MKNRATEVLDNLVVNVELNESAQPVEDRMGRTHRQYNIYLEYKSKQAVFPHWADVDMPFIDKKRILSLLITECEQAMTPFHEFADRYSIAAYEDLKAFHMDSININRLTRKLFGPDYKMLFATHFILFDDIPF